MRSWSRGFCWARGKKRSFGRYAFRASAENKKIIIKLRTTNYSYISATSVYDTAELLNDVKPFSQIDDCRLGKYYVLRSYIRRSGLPSRIRRRSDKTFLNAPLWLFPVFTVEHTCRLFTSPGRRRNQRARRVLGHRKTRNRACDETFLKLPKTYFCARVRVERVAARHAAFLLLPYRYYYWCTPKLTQPYSAFTSYSFTGFFIFNR